MEITIKVKGKKMVSYTAQEIQIKCILLAGGVKESVMP